MPPKRLRKRRDLKTRVLIFKSNQQGFVIIPARLRQEHTLSSQASGTHLAGFVRHRRAFQEGGHGGWPSLSEEAIDDCTSSVFVYWHRAQHSSLSDFLKVSTCQTCLFQGAICGVMGTIPFPPPKQKQRTLSALWLSEACRYQHTIS